MPSCVIFGGAGFVGTHLARHFLATKRFTHIHLADIRTSPLEGSPDISCSVTDVRNPIAIDLIKEKPEWIINLAAIHREPGHQPNEYFETNLKGAQHVCAYAEAVGCSHIFFTSSIAVYGPALTPTDEYALNKPITPYGGSKYPAELIHQIWLNASPDRRLIITRPGVIYGPGDPGNIMRMIQAIRRGYFVFPGSKKIHKSYAYIYGFLDSVDFVMNQDKKLIIYNYVETPTETIEAITQTIKRLFNSKAPIVSLPGNILKPVARVLQQVAGKNNPIHPVRVKKAATPTHIVPKVLQEMGFTFAYDFEKSITHWRQVAPEDFSNDTRIMNEKS